MTATLRPVRPVRDADVAGRRVLVRADLNVPLADGRVADDTRAKVDHKRVAVIPSAAS